MAKQVWCISLNFVSVYVPIWSEALLIINFVIAQAVHRQIPLLVRTIGSSTDLLDIISDPPTGSEGLILQVLFFIYFSPIILDCAVCDWLWLLMQLQVVHTLTDGTVPSPDLVSTIKRLYVTKLKVIMDNVLTYSILSQLGSLFMWFCCFWSVIDSCFSGYWYSNSSTSLLIKRWGQNHPELPSIILLLLWPRVKITLLLLARFYYFFPI